jgi:hypothetical protein
MGAGDVQRAKTDMAPPSSAPIQKKREYNGFQNNATQMKAG